MRETYDRIAPGWYNFRHWSIFPRELEMLARRWGSGKLLNVGSAHGPDFLPFREHFELYGADFSPEMIRLAARYAEKFAFRVNLAVADVRALPYEEETFDWAISVATYHHLMESAEQEKAFIELWRVLKPGAETFVTVWNRSQPRFWFTPRQTKVPWHTREGTIYRDYYLFRYGELEKRATQAGFSVVCSFPESAYRFPLKHFSRNICLLLEKPGERRQLP